jgi:hypothetical protein
MRYFILLVVISGFASCHLEQKDKGANKVLAHHTVELNDEFIGRGGFLLGCKNGLIGLEESASFPAFYQVKNIKGDYILSRFVNRGQGPDEVLHPLNLQYINEDTMGVYDFMNMSYYHVPVLRNNGSIHIRKCASFDTRYYRVMKTAYEQYIALSATDGLFSLLDAGGKRMDTFFEYPYKNKDEKNIANSIRALAYQGTMATSPDATKCVYAPFNGDIIHFYAMKKDDIRLISKTENNFPDYVIIDDMPGAKPNTITGYVSVTATDHFVYALFCGKTIKELKEKNKDSMEGQTLRIFDWNGTIKTEIDLDIPCKYIGVSPDDKTVWAIALMPEISLVRFSMNEETDQKKETVNHTLEQLTDKNPEDDNDTVANKLSSEIRRINLKEIHQSKTANLYAVFESLLDLKSVETTTKDIKVDVKHEDNSTVVFYQITKEKTGEFNDTVTINFTNNDTYTTIFNGRVIDNP